MTVQTIEYFVARATKRVTSELNREPDIELAMPINRATVICEKTPETSEPEWIKYWERTHTFHATKSNNAPQEQDRPMS